PAPRTAIRGRDGGSSGPPVTREAPHVSPYPKPFFRAPRGLWYVQIDGRQVNLGPDRDEALRRYHDLIARGPDRPEAATGDAVVSVLHAFLDWCQKHRAPRTYDCNATTSSPLQIRSPAASWSHVCGRLTCSSGSTRNPAGAAASAARS